MTSTPADLPETPLPVRVRDDESPPPTPPPLSLWWLTAEEAAALTDADGNAP
ncbi:hypothetical protein ACIP93_37500 [Streptomyces sp. NPDC088745]|uniref:hypothetical protein n=1 Tax=Streptomyces sp. NPDC088745 TaxID=3365884 RepID=UPI00381FF17E